MSDVAFRMINSLIIALLPADGQRLDPCKHKHLSLNLTLERGRRRNTIEFCLLLKPGVFI